MDAQLCTDKIKVKANAGST